MTIFSRRLWSQWAARALFAALPTGVMFAAEPTPLSFPLPILTNETVVQADCLPTAMPLNFVGTASCAAAACHGSDGRLGSKGAEFTTWMSLEDPHAKAAAVLYNEVSARIQRNRGSAFAAHLDAACLKCHATPAAGASLAQHGAASGDAFGVGCEACHGPASGWLAAHTGPGWKHLPAAIKAQHGFRTQDLTLDRIQSCVQCHVGEPGREVDHDLIAAGHPRLYFEASAFLATLPRHWAWTLRHRPTPTSADAVREWAIGQALTASATLTLTAHHLEQPTRWPELAEFNCASCHHDLRSNSLPSSGKLQWGTAPFAMLPSLAAATAPGLGAEIDAIRGRFNASLNIDADRSEWAGRTRVEAQRWAELARTLDGQPWADAQALAVLQQVLASQPKNWDECVQAYLMIRTVARPAMPLAGVQQELISMLQLPVGSNSPPVVNPDRFMDRLRMLGGTAPVFRQQ